MIRQRIKHNKPFAVVEQGHLSPLLPIEPTIVQIIIQLSCIYQCNNPSQGLMLINSIIEGTPAQSDLIEWKLKIGCFRSDLGRAGAGYWRGFLKRNGNKIVSRKGLKYEINRAKWSTYAIFRKMYDGVIHEFAPAGISKERESPAWMDRMGNAVEEKDAYRCIVTHDITDPDYVITLSGLLVMCCIIFSGITENPLRELGLDLTADVIGDHTDDDFFHKKSGEGKAFPEGPSCNFRGKIVPCFCRWIPKGSITTVTLRYILATLDKLQVYDRTEKKLPCVLIDGHGSRFGLPFLNYASNPLHEWCVVIGLPYTTALWQVGNSPEQNGSHNTTQHQQKRRGALLKRRRSILLHQLSSHGKLFLLYQQRGKSHL